MGNAGNIAQPANANAHATAPVALVLLHLLQVRMMAWQIAEDRGHRHTAVSAASKAVLLHSCWVVLGQTAGKWAHSLAAGLVQVQAGTVGSQDTAALAVVVSRCRTANNSVGLASQPRPVARVSKLCKCCWQVVGCHTGSTRTARKLSMAGC